MANATDRPRCSWSTKTARECAYHDAEWGVPVRDSRMLWETLMLEGFQAGLAWSALWPMIYGDASVNRQRMVNKALGDIPGERVHALAIRASAPGEG